MLFRQVSNPGEKVVVRHARMLGLGNGGPPPWTSAHGPVVAVTPPLGAYPQPQPPQGPFLPAPPHQAAPQYSGEIRDDTTFEVE